MTTPILPALVAGFLDDAAVFPPGSTPLPEAVEAHRWHGVAPYADVVGPFVIADSMLGELDGLMAEGSIPLAVTVPSGVDGVASVLQACAAMRMHLRALEIALPPGADVGNFFAGLGRIDLPGIEVFVEVPRDARRAVVIESLVSTGFRAKFRTGGVEAELHPDERELAASICSVVDMGVAFKATAGLHHAVRNTDPDTGFEQHGFLNVVLAVDARLEGASESELGVVLADRDSMAIAARVRGLGDERVAAARARFVSFGTCSIADPLSELAGMGLVPGSWPAAKGRGALA